MIISVGVRNTGKILQLNWGASNGGREYGEQIGGKIGVLYSTCRVMTKCWEEYGRIDDL